MMATSTFFQKLLGPGSQFKEAVEFCAHRALEPFKVSINLDDHERKNCEAMLLIHGQSLNVNEGKAAADLDYLFEMASLAVYLDCGPALTMWATLALPRLASRRG